ncbi:MAG TPA: aminotransferase class I/II-fold pyridoxal phosphate-dependent enzyme, partial [Telluria sp.]|nr:aminotransferase class I/II-fold pyridoxal phosphate-dependent enzyme [Telluria sp.]
MKISARISSARPLATTAMHGRAENLRAEGKEVIDFSIAVSHFAAPQAVVDAVRAGLDQRTPLPYTSVSGALPLRRNLAAKLRRENAIDADPQEIIATNGAKQALYQALYVLTDPGDAVIVFAPYWPAYRATLELLGLHPVYIDLPATLTAADLARWPAAKLVILNNPHNPSGKVFTTAELAALTDWMAAHGAAAVVDESYEHLIFEGRHISLAATCDWRAAGVVTLFSASQSYGMMGWRAGFALAPAPVVAAMETLQGPITAAPAALSQLACDAAFAGGPARAMLDDYRQRRDLAVGRFAALP